MISFPILNMSGLFLYLYFHLLFLKEGQKNCVSSGPTKPESIPGEYNLINTVHPENIISLLMESSWIHRGKKWFQWQFLN